MAGFGGSVKLTGESEYRKALNSITDNLKVLSSEMKVITSQYDKNDKSVENLGSQNEVLNKKITEQQQKVNLLTKALADSKEETGENSVTTKKWQNELNNAQSELNALKKKVNDNETAMEQSEDATEENAKSLKKFGNEAKESGTHALKLGDIIKANLISDAIKGGLSALANSMKQLGSALVGVGKEAIASFADYEQLIGGVETLFKDSAGIVEGYANNAYKSAGLSANEYMETVTSFSASLLASLDGDTEKSAKIADMAITDMSDNANKMGTDMSMIQNAYQGFAKQNYTMLDNLKLGYGGTKEEMQRLLREAEAMPEAMGQKFDISNYADVVKAINVVQQNMGITGTTAKEASETIAGSTASMKSAWQNLLTGLVDDNANFGELVNNFSSALVTMLNNLLPRIGDALLGVVRLIAQGVTTILPQLAPMITTLLTDMMEIIYEWLPDLIASADMIITTLIDAITTVLPGLISVGVEVINSLIIGIANALPDILNAGIEIIKNLINGIGETIPTLIPTIVDVLKTLIDTITNNLPQILEMGITVLLELVKGISESLPELIPVIVDAVLLIVDSLIDNIDMIIDGGIMLILALADGLIEALPRLIEKAPVILQKLVDAIVRNFPKVVQAGGQLIGKLIVGIVGSLGELLMQAPKIIKTIVQGIASFNEQIKQTGVNLVKGIWEGITGSLQWLKDKVKGWVGNVLNFIKNLFGINSPSKVFEEEIGNNLALGIGEGFAGTMDNVNKQMGDAIQTDYDLSVNSNLKGANATGTPSYYLDMVNAFKQALKEVKVVMDDREMGTFVTDTMERVVYT